MAATPWLGLTPAATLSQLAEFAVLHRMPAGGRLFEQAEMPSFAQLVASGSVALLGVSGSAEALIELVRPIDLLQEAAPNATVRLAMEKLGLGAAPNLGRLLRWRGAATTAEPLPLAPHVG